MITYDAMIHLCAYGSDGWENVSEQAARPEPDSIRRCLQAYQKAGITFLRDAGDFGDVSRGAKTLAREYGISLLSAGCPLAQEGKCGNPHAALFHDREDFRRKLVELKQNGADFVYLFATGLPDLSEYGSVRGEPMDSLLLEACIADAHEEGFPVAVECSGAESVSAAIEAGADSIEHGWYADQETLRIWAESDTVWVPSVVTAGNGITDESHRYPEDLLKRILDEQLWKVGTLAGWGGNIALGSNAGAYGASHIQSAMDEYDFLKEELGDSLDSLLQSGEVMLRWKFNSL